MPATSSSDHATVKVAFGEFADEVSYVARQSQEVWEPLFGHYYATAWLLAERDGGGRHRPPEFFSWVQELFPGVYQALLARAQRPPVPPAYEPGGPGSFVPGTPGPGESLTRAYYELLAVQAARHNFFLGMRLAVPEVVAPAPSGGWIERALAWVVRVVQERFGALVRQRGPGLATWAVEHLAGLDLKGRAADCLIAETVVATTGGPALVSPDRGQDILPAVVVSGHAGPEAPQIEANYHLRVWNEWEATRRRTLAQFVATPGDLPPGVRYVSIAGQIPNVWSGLWPQVGPNDVIVETSSTYLPLRENDAYHLIPSLFRTNHVSIGASGASWRALVGSLRDYYPIRASFMPRYVPGRSRLVSYTRRGTVQAEVYQPAYIELKVPAGGRVGARVEYTLERLGPGGEPGELSAWAYLELPGRGLYRYPLVFEPVAPGSPQVVAAVEIDVPDAEGARLLVGARVGAFGHPAQGPPDNTRLPYRYELSYTPLGAPVAGEAVQVPKGPVELADPGVAPGSAAHQNASPITQPVSPGAHDGASAAPESPVIRAVYRNKQPVRMEEEIAAHERWEWDFGDGAGWVDSDPANVESEVAHSYTQPGNYTVQAVSWSSDGRKLAVWEWVADVLLDRAGLPISFLASTLDAPEVRLTLDGPLAWVTGRSADYHLSYEIIPQPGTVTVAEVAHLYPGPHFQMVWERPGTFLVNGALTLRLTYFDGTGLRSVTNVYTVEQEVRVYATVVTD